MVEGVVVSRLSCAISGFSNGGCVGGYSDRPKTELVRQSTLSRATLWG